MFFDLHGAKLNGAMLFGAYLEGCILRYVSLNCANMYAADLTSTIIDGVDFYEIRELTEEQIKSAIFFTRSGIRESEITGVSLSNFYRWMFKREFPVISENFYNNEYQEHLKNINPQNKTST